MKKILALILCLVLVMCVLSGCSISIGNKSQNVTSTDSSSTPAPHSNASASTQNPSTQHPSNAVQNVSTPVPVQSETVVVNQEPSENPTYVITAPVYEAPAEEEEEYHEYNNAEVILCNHLDHNITAVFMSVPGDSWGGNYIEGGYIPVGSNVGVGTCNYNSESGTFNLYLYDEEGSGYSICNLDFRAAENPLYVCIVVEDLNDGEGTFRATVY